MSDARPPARSVSCLAVLAILVGFALFFLPLRLLYVDRLPPAVGNEAPENLSADQQWRATPALRRAYLVELRAKQTKQLETYAWVNRPAGVVQLPIERAMELVVQQYGPKQ